MEPEKESTPFKLRADLEWSRYGTSEGGDWIVSDPIALEYFYFSELEKNILQLLDGSTTLETILGSKHGSSINQEWLWGLVYRAHSACLLISHQPSNHGALLWRQSERILKSSRLQWLFSPLSFRIRLFDPTPLLDALAPIAEILFCKTMRWLVGLAIPVVAFFVLARLLQSSSEVAFFQNGGSSTEQIFVLLLVYLVIKSLHELGHALACKKWRAECHEIGVMFLVFTPCLYCDTSDCWRIPDHRRRAGIAAAGIYVEMLIALVAAVVWLTTLPVGTVHGLAMYTMIVSSVSTLLVNANPLLRYDGYYVLSDLLRIPNLSQQSQEALQGALISFFTGEPVPHNRWDSSLRFLLSYELLAIAYRLVLFVFIIGLVWVTLNQLGLRLVAVGVISLATFTMALGVWRKFKTTVKEIIAIRRIRILRTVLFLGTAIYAFWAIFTIPWPTYAHARAISKFSDLVPVFTKQSGHLTNFRGPGALLETGGEIARLSSPSLQFQLIEIEGELRQAQERLSQLNLSRVDDKSASADLKVTAEQIVAIEAQKRILEDELNSLSIRATEAGRYLWDETQGSPTLTDAPNLDQWNPLMTASNIGCLVEKGTLLGWIAPGNRIHLTAIVSEQDARIIEPGAKVICKWDCELSQTYEGLVTQVSTEPIDELPRPLTGDPHYYSYTGMNNNFQAQQQRYYQVKIALDRCPAGVTHLSLSSTHIFTGNRTLWEIIVRYFTLNVRPIIENQ